jgi:hypothetical protein
MGLASYRTRSEDAVRPRSAQLGFAATEAKLKRKGRGMHFAAATTTTRSANCREAEASNAKVGRRGEMRNEKCHCDAYSGMLDGFPAGSTR